MKTISVYDLDDTLTETKTFSAFVGAEDGQKIDTFTYYPAYFKSVKSMFLDKLSKGIYFKRMGDFVVPINDETDIPFSAHLLDVFNGDKRKDKMFQIHSDTIILRSFAGFHSDPATIGKIINEFVHGDYV